MSEQFTKKQKVSDELSSDHNKENESFIDMKVTLLEQRLFELQTINSDYLLASLQASNPDPLCLYTDPLINYEIAVLKKREELLIEKVLELQQGVQGYNITNNSDVLQPNAHNAILQNEIDELKFKLKLSDEANQSKDIAIKDLYLELSETTEHIKELSQDNDNLKSQLFLYAQLINQLQNQLNNQIQHPANNNNNIQSEDIILGDESPTLEVDD